MNFDDPKVGGQAAMALTRTRGKLNDGSMNPYAFGIAHGEYRGLANVSHSGGWAQFATFVLHFPQQHFGVVVLANSSSINPTRAAFNIADIYLGNELTGPPPGPNAIASAPTVDVEPAMLDRYAGLYRLGPGWYVRVRRDGGTLKVQASREDEVATSAKSDTLFWVPSYNAPIVFQTPRGKPVQLVYRGRTQPKLQEYPTPTGAKLREYVGDSVSDELATTYRVELTDSGLVMNSRRVGNIRLTPLWKDDFGGSMWFTRSVEFLRDPQGRVTGFSVYIDDRSGDVRFVRRR
jgi:hypothetical protein